MPTSMLRRALLAGTCSFAFAAPAFAQDAGAYDPNDPKNDIVVTAQNRVENVQNVPIAISVVSGDELKSQGVTDFASVQRVSPSLQITSDTSLTKVSIRGVGTVSNNEAQDQSIAVNIDGEYINRPTVLNAAIFDVDRVEVLRGPQGTLYGRNSTGGAVNFITRKPGEVFAVNASASYGNFNQLILEGGVDIPLGDFGGIRVAGSYSDRDGYNIHPNDPLPSFIYPSSPLRRSGDDHTWGGRISLRLTPITGLKIDLAYERTQSRIHPADYAFVDFNAGGNGPGAGCNGNGFVVVGNQPDVVNGVTVPGIQCVPANTNYLSKIDRSRYDMAATGVGYFNQNSDAVRGRIAYDFGGATLTYTGGYRESLSTGINTLTPAYAFTNYGAPVKTQSHELRLNGLIGGITWQVGAFYFKEDQSSDGGLYIPFIGPQGSYVNYFVHPVHTESKSAFGQFEVPLTDKLTAVAGGRYTDDKRTGDFKNYFFAFNSGMIRLTNQPSATTPLSYSGNHFNWLLGLNYKPSRDALVYAKVSTGYKAGGFDGTGTDFRPETNTAYEGGLKLKFGRDRENIFNIAGFYYDYKDLQNEVLLNPNIGGQTFNAGRATIWGVEAEANIRLSKNDTFYATVNYLHATYNDFVATLNVYDPVNPGRNSLDAGTITNLKGNWLAQSPEWVIGLGYDHVFDLGAAGKITASAYSRFKSAYYSDYFNYRDSKQSAYTQTDLTLEYKPLGRHFTVQAFVRNLENYRPLTFAAYVSAGNDDIFNWQFAPPRTYGARLAIDF